MQGTLLAAAVIGCFSWSPIQHEYWLGPAAWYSSLVLSISAVLLSSSEAFIFSTIRDAPIPPNLSNELKMIIRVNEWDEESRFFRRSTLEGESSRQPGLKQKASVIVPLGAVSEGRIPTPEERSSRQSTAQQKVKTNSTIKSMVKWNMVFTWQAPIMLLAYSVLGFITGLTIYVCTPLYNGKGFSDGSKVSSPHWTR